MRIGPGRMRENQCSSSTFNLSVGGRTTLMFLGLFIRLVLVMKKAFLKYKGKAHICNLSPLQEQMVIRNTVFPPMNYAEGNYK